MYIVLTVWFIEWKATQVISIGKQIMRFVLFASAKRGIRVGSQYLNFGYVVISYLIPVDAIDSASFYNKMNENDVISLYACETDLRIDTLYSIIIPWCPVRLYISSADQNLPYAVIFSSISAINKFS